MKYTPEDFSFEDAAHSVGSWHKNRISKMIDGKEYIPIETASKIANTMLFDWLDEAQIVYHDPRTNNYWTENSGPISDENHGFFRFLRKAKLVCIEEIKP